MKFNDKEKFYKDGTGQYDRYRDVAADQGSDTRFRVLNVHEDCTCSDNDNKKQPQTVPVMPTVPRVAPQIAPEMVPEMVPFL